MSAKFAGRGVVKGGGGGDGGRKAAGVKLANLVLTLYLL